MSSRFVFCASALFSLASIAAQPKAGGTSGNPKEVDLYESRNLRIRLAKPAEWTPIDTGMHLRLGSMSMDNVADRFAMSATNTQIPWVVDKATLHSYLDEMYACSSLWSETNVDNHVAFICKTGNEARVGALREAGEILNLRLRYPGEDQYQRILRPILNSIHFVE